MHVLIYMDATFQETIVIYTHLGIKGTKNDIYHLYKLDDY